MNDRLTFPCIKKTSVAGLASFQQNKIATPLTLAVTKYYPYRISYIVMLLAIFGSIHYYQETTMKLVSQHYRALSD
jgi:hypothetical protein